MTQPEDEESTSTVAEIRTAKSGSAVHRLARAARRWITLPRLALVTLRLIVPIALFGRYHRFSYLDPRAASKMMVFDDWTTYVVGPNYLRSAPILSFPFGQIPDYLAPAGSSIGKVDSVPLLIPLYRLIMAIFPDQPIQIVGLLLLVAFVLVFNFVAHFVDLIDVDLAPAIREAVTLAFAAILTVAPFWNLQYVHPALMQQWILVWALIGALRRCPTFLDGKYRQIDARWCGLGPIWMASVVQPYLLPMAAATALAPDLADLRARPREVLRKVAVAGAGAACLAYSVGFIGHGGNLGSDGFGNYAGDLLAPVDPDLQSRFVVDVPNTAGSIGGYAYAGMGGLLLILVGISAVVSTRLRRRLLSKDTDRVPQVGAARLRVLGAMVAVLTLYSALPVLRIAGRPILDFSRVFDRFDGQTSIFRVNGRFVWVAVWLAMLLGVAYLVTKRRQRTMLLASGVMLCLQLFDVVPWTPLARTPGSDEYPRALGALRAAASSGAEEVQFQPPVVVPGCYPADYGSFTTLGDTLLAASVVGLPVNSGYTARLSPEFIDLNCERQVEEFNSGQFSDEVLYIVPTGAITPTSLECSPVTSVLQGCRSVRP